MTDISDLREGDEIDVTIRYTVVRMMDVLAARHGREEASNLRYLLNIAESITVVHPEIIPGKPYVDASGKLYVGKSGDRVVHVNAEGRGIYHGVGPEHRPLPRGLRPAKVVPES